MHRREDQLLREAYFCHSFLQKLGATPVKTNVFKIKVQHLESGALQRQEGLGVLSSQPWVVKAQMMTKTRGKQVWHEF